MSAGVDVSKWQGSIDWPVARREIEFAYAKITEGVGYVDPACDRHLAGARAAGLVVGGYHYARPDTNSPEAEAAHFAMKLKQRDLAEPGALPPCLDMEQDARVNMVSWTVRCITRLRELTGYGPVMVYANTAWWRNQLAGGGWMDDQTFAWVAHYGRAAGDPAWKGPRAVMHQWTSTGRIGGYGDSIDLNACWVPLGELTSGALPPPPPVPPDPRPDGWYTVRTGQTLSEIGAELGIDWEVLAQWNNLADPDLILPGQRLRTTPPDVPTAGTHLVQPGQTLSAIGEIHDVPWQSIWQANKGLIGGNPNLIQPGWVLSIPAAGSPAPAPPTERVWVVKPGQTLSWIAQQVEWDWRKLAKHNGLANPNLIIPGQEIRY